jgi:hypothetical protein
MSNPLIQKDFYKMDVYRFDVEHVLDDYWYDVTINNSISWDYMNIRASKEELKGLADFIYKTIGEKK